MRSAKMLATAGLIFVVGALIWGFTPVMENGPCGSLFVAQGDERDATAYTGWIEVPSTCAATRQAERAPVFLLFIVGTAMLGAAQAGNRRRFRAGATATPMSAARD